MFFPLRSLSVSVAPRPGRAARALLGVALVLCLSWPAAAASSVASALEALLTVEASGPAGERASAHRVAVQRIYADRAFEPLWVTEAGPSERARELVGIIGKADQDGLDPADYDHERLAAGLQAPPDPASLAELEQRLSRAFLRYSNDLRSGRVTPREVDSELNIDPRPFDAHEALRHAASADDLTAFVAGFAPQSPNYTRLKEALARYRTLAAEEGWGRVPEGATLRAGERSPHVAAVRDRLLRTGELLGPAADAEFYDETLEAAVRVFQDRHGLDVDGAIGPKTLAAMNVTVEDRIQQMLLNMERRRWMPDDLGERHVFVNLADFEMKLVEGPKTVFDSRVVIGSNVHRTPVFSGEMTYLVLNPYWNVPPSIASKELLPKIRRDVNYFANNNFKLFSGWGADAGEIDLRTVDWSRVSPRSFPYKVRQDAGDDNALGRVKFMFPNRFNIYLHDTPSRGLFSRSVRNFSHGCIRVAKPIDLAEMILRHDPEWTRERIEQVVSSGEQRIVKLKDPVMVHITYLTAWVNKDGTLHFRNDVYERDPQLAAAVFRES